MSDLPVDPEHLRALLADTVDLAAILDLDGKVRYLNRAGHRLLALPPDASVTTVSAFDLIAEIDQPLLEHEILPALDADGWWTGNLAVLNSAVAEVPTRSTLRVQPASGTDPARLTWIARDISTEKAVYERLHKKIFEDELTGLPHRSIFLDRLDLALRRTADDAVAVALLFVSLDRFKEKNDRFGREVGDQLLQAVAQRLSASGSDRHRVALGRRRVRGHVRGRSGPARRDGDGHTDHAVVHRTVHRAGTRSSCPRRSAWALPDPAR